MGVATVGCDVGAAGCDVDAAVGATVAVASRTVGDVADAGVAAEEGWEAGMGAQLTSPIKATKNTNSEPNLTRTSICHVLNTYAAC